MAGVGPRGVPRGQRAGPRGVGVGGKRRGAHTLLTLCHSQFGIVFDAGSSHTSLFVYRWPADKENDTGVVSQALACQVKGQRAALSEGVVLGAAP